MESIQVVKYLTIIGLVLHSFTVDQLPVGYWESLGPNGPFLRSLFMSQQEQVQQLRDTNTFLQSQVANTHDDITNVASIGDEGLTWAHTCAHTRRYKMDGDRPASLTQSHNSGRVS